MLPTGTRQDEDIRPQCLVALSCVFLGMGFKQSKSSPDNPLYLDNAYSCLRYQVKNHYIRVPILKLPRLVMSCNYESYRLFTSTVT